MSENQDRRQSDDYSMVGLLKRNWPGVVSLILGLIVQGVTVTWMLSSQFADLKQRQEITNIKVGQLEERMRDWYTRGDAARDFALRDQRDAELQRRVDLLEQDQRDRRR